MPTVRTTWGTIHWSLCIHRYPNYEDSKETWKEPSLWVHQICGGSVRLAQALGLKSSVFTCFGHTCLLYNSATCSHPNSKSSCCHFILFGFCTFTSSPHVITPSSHPNIHTHNHCFVLVISISIILCLTFAHSRITTLSVSTCNATTGIIVRRASRVLVLRRVKPYQGLSSVMHKYQVELRSRLVWVEMPSRQYN